MRVGGFRHYVTLQQATETQDSAGQPVPAWSTVLSNWPANVRDVSGAEATRGGQITATATHVVETRYSSEFTQDRRLIDHLSRELEIVAIKDVAGRQRHIELHCKRVSV